MRRSILRTVAAAIAVLLPLSWLAACSEDPGVVVTESDRQTTAVASSTPPETAGATPATTSAPTSAPTTMPATTTPSTTGAPPSPETTNAPAVVPAGWTSGEFPQTVFPPCCASNWYGEASPPAPADPAAPLEDGLYHLTVTSPWSSEIPSAIDIEVRPFVWCGDLPENSCEMSDSYAPDELGVDETVLRAQTLMLDETIRVGVVGWGEEGPISQFGNGSDLAVLAAAFDAAITAVVTPRLAAGEDSFDIVQDLAANPSGGFGPVKGERANLYEIVFDAGSGPDLLLQTVASWESMGGDGPQTPLPVFQELNPTVFEVRDGVATLYFYAGFYS